MGLFGSQNLEGNTSPSSPSVASRLSEMLKNKLHLLRIRNTFVRLSGTEVERAGRRNTHKARKSSCLASFVSPITRARSRVASHLEITGTRGISRILNT